jgi:hypothetical protein
MTDTAVLTREQEDLLVLLVDARRRAGEDYTEGFRAPLFLLQERWPLYYPGFPREGIEVDPEDLYALQRGGYVDIYESGFTRVIRVDLTQDGFAHVDRNSRESN